MTCQNFFQFDMKSLLQEKLSEEGLVRLVSSFEGSELDFKIVLDKITPSWLKTDSYDFWKMNIVENIATYQAQHHVDSWTMINLGYRTLSIRLIPLREWIQLGVTQIIPGFIIGRTPLGWSIEVWKANMDEDEPDDNYFNIQQLGDGAIKKLLHTVTTWILNPTFCSLCFSGVHQESKYPPIRDVCTTCCDHVSLNPCYFCKRKLGKVTRCINGNKEWMCHHKCMNLHLKTASSST